MRFYSAIGIAPSVPIRRSSSTLWMLGEVETVVAGEDGAVVVGGGVVGDKGDALYADELVDGESSMLESIVVLANTCIGAGVLAVPYSLSVCGVGLGLALLVGVAIMSMYSFYLLADTRRLSGARSYEDLVAFYFGSGGRGVVQASLVLLLMGAMVIYAILLSDSIHPIVSEYAPASPWLSRNMLSIYAVILVYPLTLANDLRFLRHTSLAALVCLVYLLVALAIRFFQKLPDISVKPGTAPGPNDSSNVVRLEYAIVSTKFFLALPIQAVAFNGQFNAVRVANELRSPTMPRLLAVSIGAVGTCLLFYVAFGLIGIYTFGAATKGDVLLNFPNDDVLINVGRGALFLVLAFSYPLFALPLRESIVVLLAPKVNLARAGFGGRVLLSTVINVVAVIAAILVPNLPAMLDIVGATCGMAIAFVLPGLCGYRAYKGFVWKQAVCVCVCGMGVFCGVVSAVVTIATWNEIGSN